MKTLSKAQQIDGFEGMDAAFGALLLDGIYAQREFVKTGCALFCQNADKVVGKLYALLAAYCAFRALTIEQAQDLDISFEVLRYPEEF